jgi:hypothetical protein
MDKPAQLIAKAETYYNYFRRDANKEARRLLQLAIDMDAKRAQAHAELAYAELTAWLYNWDPTITCLDSALEHAKEAVACDDDDYYNHWILADVHLYRRDFDKAVDLFDLARSKAATQAIPEEQRALQVDWADMLLLTGEAKKAIQVAEEAIAQSPIPERWFHWVLGWAYYADGQHQKSLDALLKMGNPRNAIRKNVIANLVALKREDDMKMHVQKYLDEEGSDDVKLTRDTHAMWQEIATVEDRVPFRHDTLKSDWIDKLSTAFTGGKA